MEHPPLQETSQKAYALSSIQLVSSASLPVLASSVIIAHQNPFLSSLLILVVTNLLLFGARYLIARMSNNGARMSTLDLSRHYIGNFGGYFVAVLLLLSTLAWYVAQTTIASHALEKLMGVDTHDSVDHFLQFSVAIGILSTLLCMEGIKALRRASVVGLPLLIFLLFVLLFFLPKMSPYVPEPTFSFSAQATGIALLLGTGLGSTADLPTFFRHSLSWKESFRAILIIQIVSFLMGLCGLFLGSLFDPLSGTLRGGYSDHLTAKALLFALIFISVIFANVVNVYSASVGWEVLAPSALVGREEYLLLGLILVIFQTLLPSSLSMEAILGITDNALVNLAIILIIAYLIRFISGIDPPPMIKRIYCLALLFMVLVNSLQFFNIVTFRLGILPTSLLIALPAGAFHILFNTNKIRS